MRMSELLNEVQRFELDEGFSPREIKMAIGIASDPRYAKGNMTGAVNAIEKMKKGLSDHPQVAAVLKRQNEKVETDEAVSPAQQAAIAISKKERGEKPKDKMDEDGHTDVASAMNNVKVAMSALTKMSGELAKLSPEDALPSWWTNKVAVAVDKLDGMADYLDTQVEKVEPSRIVEPYRPEFGLDEAPKMTYALVGTDMKIYAIDSDEKNMKLNRRSLEKRFKDVSPLKIARLKTAQSIGDTVDKSQLKEETLGLDEISTFSRAHIAILKKTFDPMRDKKLGPKGQAKLSKIMDMIGDKKDALIDLFKADIPFVSQSAAAMLITKYNMKGDEINKLKEEVEIDEASKEGTIKIIKTKDGKFQIQKMTKGKFVDIGKKYNSAKEAEKFRSGQPDLFGEEVNLDEKYDLYHKDFSSAMQHAYDYAKSKMGITVDPKEIDSKVATGPKKPTEGKTNKYMLKGKGGNLQIQVYNKGGSKPFELNMYKEENALIAAAVGYLSND